jgi:outer membrane putative beta-barrel porin/alpha-amylase
VLPRFSDDHWQRIACLLVFSMMIATRTTAAVTDPPDDASTRQSRDDAWWTGPLLAPSASTLPHGHFLIEPYVYDLIVYGHYDDAGAAERAAREHNYGSLTYVLYGVTDRLTVGAIPRFGLAHVVSGNGSSGAGVGDVTVQAQYRLALFEEGRRVPTISLTFGETFPTGKYDHLSPTASDALGSGAYTSILSAYSQYFFWMPNGRIVRTRLNLSYSRSSGVDIRDRSVYGTALGFHGTAQPGDSVVLDSAWEYSITRKWVAAFDIVYERDGRTLVDGMTAQRTNVSDAFPSSASLIVAPAIEYNWSGKAGIIVGARIVPRGRNAAATFAPVVAINLVY